MKVSITLTDNEVIGIKKYLYDINGYPAEKDDIVVEIQSIVSGYINSENVSISSYINDSKK
jgi:hypothetical protein